jgi:CubicO group peptidase (beta-lactamase class C family)
LFSVLFGLFLAGSVDAARPLDELAGKAMTAYHLPGLSVAVIDRGKVVALKGYGYADPNDKTPATEKTIYGLASVTKPFTAAAILLLVQDGKLSLDTPARTLLPELPATWSAITVRHLLTHTSGAPAYTSEPTYAAHETEAMKPAQVLAPVFRRPLNFPPGQQMDYSNTGYFLLGLILERASGRTYDDFLRQRMWVPLGMADTCLDGPAVVNRQRAVGHVFKRGWQRASLTHPSQSFSAGGLVTTVADMVKWELALRDGRVVSKELQRQMFSPGKLNDGRETQYGFGWYLRRIGGHAIAGHPGAITGYSAGYFRCLDCDLAVIALTNVSFGVDMGDLVRKIGAIYRPELARAARPALGDPDPNLSARLKKLVLDLVAGRPIDAALTTEMAGALNADAITDIQANLNAYGALREWVLVGRDQENDYLQVRYRGVFGETPVLVLFVLTEDAKIAGFWLQPE